MNVYWDTYQYMRTSTDLSCIRTGPFCLTCEISHKYPYNKPTRLVLQSRAGESGVPFPGPGTRFHHNSNSGEKSHVPVSFAFLLHFPLFPPAVLACSGCLWYVTLARREGYSTRTWGRRDDGHPTKVRSSPLYFRAPCVTLLPPTICGHASVSRACSAVHVNKTSQNR